MPSGKASLLIAVGLGVLAGAAAYAAVKGQEKRVHSEWKTVRVLCAARDVAEGTELAREMVAVREIPLRFVTDSYTKVEEDGSVKNDPVGQRVLVPLKAGDPILLSHLEPAREAEFSAMIHAKGRAVTIDVQERNAVGLWVRPNDHVDVLGSFRDGTQQLKTVTLLQNVVVLATGRVNAATTRVGEEDRRYTSVTLLVLPEEAEILTLAQETGTLTLLLRNPEDVDQHEQRLVVDQRQLLTGEHARELQEKRYRTIQIIRGPHGTGMRGD
ncbi:MAG TPA: Flp pilus assembly protein CpaB [Myxococcales bacterium]|nr:Flp pilus assembly protein CpaB [Myxococcales bacterium]